MSVIRWSMVFAALTACAEETDPAAATDGEAAAAAFDDDALAADLWDAIQGWETWGQRAGWTPTPVPSPSHAGDLVSAYYGPSLLAWDLTGTAPADSVAVKAQYDDEDGEPKAFTAMWKVDGYDPDGSDWFWARFAADGSVTVAGSPGACTGCHSQVEETSDWVFGAPSE